MRRVSILAKPRYEARRLDVPVGERTHGTFDTFAQEFVARELHTAAQAPRAAARYNEKYEEWIAA